MNVSFEIVPRDEQSLLQQIQFIQENLPFIDTINVPDLLRMPIRSWSAGSYIDREQYRFIPHFRAIDFNLAQNKLHEIIEAQQLDRILLVSGDPPPTMAHKVYETDVIHMIRLVRRDFPHMEIYAGFDPYRSSIKQERAYIHRKLDAGVDYLLSQPFFDMRLLEIYSEMVPPEKVYWGISPVASEKSRNYWENVNHAVFPQNFRVDYDWNVQFALQVLQFSRQRNSNVYFMPISIKLENYFGPICSQFGINDL